jgi:SRSO17 transposase
VDARAEALLAFHRRFATCFRCREQRHWSLFYLFGQLSHLERKTIETMVLNLRSADVGAVRDLERFMSEECWDQPHMIEQQQVVAAEWLGEPDGVVIADGSGFPKQGDQSDGVAYPYCGHQGVFLVYASARGHTFLDAQLYLP